MKFLYCLFVITVAQASVVRHTRETKDIPAPEFSSDTGPMKAPYPGFHLEWYPVTNPDSSNPVIGYQVKLWESKSTEDYKVPLDILPAYAPYKVFVVEAGTSISIPVNQIMMGPSNLVAVQAYTMTGYGPYSSVIEFGLRPYYLRSLSLGTVSEPPIRYCSVGGFNPYD